MSDLRRISALEDDLRELRADVERLRRANRRVRGEAQGITPRADPHMRFGLFNTQRDGWCAHPITEDPSFRYLSAFADTPQEALRELLEVVIPAAVEVLEEQG